MYHLPFTTVIGALHLFCVYHIFEIGLTPLAHTEPQGTESAEKRLSGARETALEKNCEEKQDARTFLLLL